MLDLEKVSTWPAELRSVLGREHPILDEWEQPAANRYASLEDGGLTKARAYDRAIQAVAAQLRSLSLVGWHCTRLTEAEIENILDEGVQPSSAAMLLHRIDRVAASGLLTPEIRDLLKARHQAADTNRAGKLWFCFYPPRLAGERGIERFFRHWGGEALYNSHEDDPVTSPPLQAIGTPALVEVDVPIESLHGRDGGLPMNIARRYVISRGHRTQEPVRLEDYAVRPLPAERVRRVVRFPEQEFMRLTGCANWRRPLG